MTRILTSFALIPLFVYIVLWAPDWAFLAAVAAVGVLCYREYSLIVRAGFPEHADMAPGLLGYIGGVLLLFLPGGEATFLTVLAMLALTLGLRARSLSSSLPGSATLVLGVLWIFGAWRCAFLLRSMGPDGPRWLFLALAINWAGDTFAFYIGRAFGRHKLAPRVSPGKSWEGALASVAGSVPLALLYTHLWLPAAPLGAVALLAAAANIFGQVGDLAESAIKRGAGVKDSGTMLPGHGGWLDRVDSSLFAIPVVYWLLQFEFFHR